jgi:hypothetical protein
MSPEPPAFSIPHRVLLPLPPDKMAADIYLTAVVVANSDEFTSAPPGAMALTR